MVGKLQVIFGVDTVVIELRIARQLLVFFEHLTRISARPVIDAVIIIETAAVILLLPVVVIIIVSTAAPIVIIRLATVVIVHKG